MDQDMLISSAVQVPVTPETSPRQKLLQGDVSRLTEQLSNCNTEMQSRDIVFSSACNYICTRIKRCSKSRSSHNASRHCKLRTSTRRSQNKLYSSEIAMRKVLLKAENTETQILTEAEIAIVNAERRSAPKAVNHAWQERESVVALAEHNERIQSSACIGSLMQAKLAQSEGNRPL